MRLRFVETDRCPVCGCDLVVYEEVETEIRGGERKIREHANGGRWETRVFACGYKVAYCPNFLREEQKDGCKRDPEYLERERKRTAAKKAVVDCISALDADDLYKKRLFDAVRYI